MLEFQTCLPTLQNDEEIFTGAKIVSFTSTQLSAVLRPALMSAALQRKRAALASQLTGLNENNTATYLQGKGGSWRETTTRQASSAAVSVHAVIGCLQMEVRLPESCGCFLIYIFFKTIYSPSEVMYKIQEIDSNTHSKKVNDKN